MSNECGSNGEIIRTYLIDDYSIVTGCTIVVDEISSCSPSGITINNDVFVNGSLYSLIFSGGTFYGDGSNLSGISTDNFYVTGGTFNDISKTLTLFRNDGNSVLITGFTDYYVTGGTYSNGSLTLERQDSSFTISGFLTGTTDTYVTGFTYDNYNLTISQNEGQPDLVVTLPPYITGFTDYYVTGGTYSNGILTLERQDSSFTIPGFLTGTTDTYVTGFTYSNNNLIISQNEGQPDLVVNIDVMSGLTINGSLSATTYLGLPIDPDNYITGGTYSNGILTLERQNGSVSISGFLSADTYVTGFTFNAGTYDLTILQNNGLPSLTQNLGILAGDITVTGGTYNPSNGVATFYNNAGGSFQVSGFLTGFTDIYLTSGSFNPNTGNLTLTRTDNVNVVVTGFTDYYVTGGTYSSGTLTLERQNGSVSITGFSHYFISGSTPTGTTINYGDRWYNTNNGIELVYINDGDNDLWVQPLNTPGPPGYSNLMITSAITTSAVTLDINVNYYGVVHTGNVDISLPNPSGYDGYNINIKDESGNANIYRIRLTPLSGLIDGNNYVDMNTKYMSLHIVARNNNWWII